MAKEQDNKPSKKEEDWMSKKWRPMMAIMYMVVCIFDFIVFPIMFTVVQFWETQAANDAFRQWNPLTLLGGGLFHVAMGAVLGVSAWSRGQEKIAGVANNNATPQLSSPNTGASTFGVSAPIASSWGSQPLGSGGGFGSTSQSTAYNSSAAWNNSPVASSGVTTGWGGKKAPPEPEYPVIG